MSENTKIVNKKGPNPQKVKWRNVAYYDTFEKADDHRNSIEGLVKVRRCGPDKTKYVVKLGISIKEKTGE